MAKADYFIGHCIGCKRQTKDISFFQIENEPNMVAFFCVDLACWVQRRANEAVVSQALKVEFDECD